MIRNPLDLSDETVTRMSREAGCTYPVTGAAVWHPGIHFTGDNALQCVCDGTIVAMRLDKEYKHIEPIKNFSMNVLTMRDADAAKAVVPLLQSAFEKKTQDGKDLYTLKGNLSNDKKIEALKALNAAFSANYVLIQHTIQNSEQTNITFFTLYHHLRPLNEISLVKLLRLRWFRLEGRVDGSVYYGVQAGWFSAIPCETNVKGKKGEKHIAWKINGKDENGDVADESVIRRFNDEHCEIKHPSDAKSGDGYCDPKYFQEKQGAVVYSTKEKSTRIAVAVLDPGSTFTVLNTGDLYSGVILVRYLDKDRKEQTGYLYLNYPHAVSEKYKKLTYDTTAETKKLQDFFTKNDISASCKAYGFSFSVKSEEGLSFDRTCAPKNRSIAQGETLGFPGLFLGTREICHFEVFSPDTSYFRRKDTRNTFPCGYRIAAAYDKYTATPTTKTKPVQMPETQQEIPAGFIVSCKSTTVRHVSDDEYLEIDFVAKKTHEDGVWVEYDKKMLAWNDAAELYGIKKESSVKGYPDNKKPNESIDITLYTGIGYRFKSNGTLSFEIVDKKGKKITLGKDARELACLYEKVQGLPSFCISGKMLRTKAIKRTGSLSNAYEIQSALTKDDFVELVGYTDPESAGQLTVSDVYTDTGVTVGTFVNKTDKEPKDTWLEMRNEKDKDDQVWIKKDAIGGKVEQLIYNDWLKFFRQVENTSSDWLIMSFKSIVKENADIEKTLSDTVRHSPSILPTVLNAEKNYQYLRTLICHVKSEWKPDDSLTKEYYRGMDSQKSNMEKVRKEVCFWDDAKGAASGCKEVKFPSSDTNYYFHPLAFLEHLRKVANFELNPYKGDHTDTDGNPFTCIDSPGFAPCVGEMAGNINGYAPVTWLFKGKVGNTIHAGIDFYGNKDGSTPIHSFLNGQVVGKGDEGDANFGNFLIIKDSRDEKRFFILGHLCRTRSTVKLGDNVRLGTIVGYVGNTGKCMTQGHVVTDTERAEGKGTHLHVQVENAKQLKDFYITETSKISGANDLACNPFTYSDLY